jgi:hypothetical protein
VDDISYLNLVEFTRAFLAVSAYEWNRSAFRRQFDDGACLTGSNAKLRRYAAYEVGL